MDQRWRRVTAEWLSRTACQVLHCGFARFCPHRSSYMFQLNVSRPFQLSTTRIVSFWCGNRYCFNGRLTALVSFWEPCHAQLPACRARRPHGAPCAEPWPPLLALGGWPHPLVHSGHLRHVCVCMCVCVFVCLCFCMFGLLRLSLQLFVDCL